MTDQPKFGERLPEHPPPRTTPSRGARIFGTVIGCFLLVVVAAVITPFIIALWRWAFTQ